MANIDVSKLTITEWDQVICFNNANELEFIMDEIQEGTISNTQDKSDVTGRGGRKIGNLKKNKGVTVDLTNGVIVGGALAAQTGTDVEQGSFPIRKTEILTVTSDTAKLNGEPVGSAGSEIGYAYIKNDTKKFSQDASASTGKFSYATKTLTFNKGEIPDGTEIVVFYNEEVTAAKISNDTEHYSKTLKMFADVTVQDTCDNLYHGQVVIERADVDGEFDIQIGGDPSVHNIKFESLAGGCSGSNKLWDFFVYQ